MYKRNDLVVYGNMGVCEIRDITTPDIQNARKGQLYYILKPLRQDCGIYTPVDTKLFMRPVIAPEEAERLIDSIPSFSAEAYHNRSMQQLSVHYETALKSYDCAALIQLVLSIHAKKRCAEEQNHKFGQIDEKFMKQAESLLHSEFSIALGIPVEKVPGYIASRVSAMTAADTQ
jgi:CarD family transcriptional regulator